MVGNFEGLRNNVDQGEELQPKIHAFSRKCQKTLFFELNAVNMQNRHTVVDNDPSNLYMNFQPNLATRSRENLQKPKKKGPKFFSDFSAKIRLRHFSSQYQKKVMRNFVTDGLTDGPGYIGPVCWSKKGA